MSIMDKYLNHVSITNDSLVLNQSKTCRPENVCNYYSGNKCPEIKKILYNLIKRKRAIVLYFLVKLLSFVYVDFFRWCTSVTGRSIVRFFLFLRKLSLSPPTLNVLRSQECGAVGRGSDGGRSSCFFTC